MNMVDVGHLSVLCWCRPQNMIAQSQSGTGKTAAFILTMLSRVDTNEAVPQVRDGRGNGRVGRWVQGLR